jgi:hypothetical protein
MSVDERHRRLYRRLEQVLGTEEAGTLIEDLSERIVTPELLRRELAASESRIEARFDAKLSIVASELRAEMLRLANEQTKTLYRTVVVSNSAMVFAVAGLAFGAARLA